MTSTSRITLFQLWRLVDLSDRYSRRQFWLAIGISSAAAIAEVVTLILVQKALKILVGGNQNGADQALTALLLAALAGSLLRLVAQRRMVHAQHTITASLSTRAFSILQLQSYARYVDGGASEGFAAFERLQIVCFNALAPMIGGLAALGTSAALILAIFALFPVVGLSIFLVIVLAGLWNLLTDTPVLVDGLSGPARERARLVFEARTAFRDICLTNGQRRMCDDFGDLEKRFRGAQERNAIAAQSARHGFEVVAMLVALVALAFFSESVREAGNLLPTLGVLVVAGLRLIPQLANVRSAIRSIELHRDVTHDVIGLLERPTLAETASITQQLTFAQCVDLMDIHFEREDRPNVLRGLNLSIARGARIGIIGQSGGGKSTLLDVLSGLLPPNAGEVRIDGVVLDSALAPAWRDRIGMVSQNPVILGRTLREVICFPDTPADADQAKMQMAIAASQLTDMAADFSLGLDTDVGEANSKLSGGQRQRLALAHAIYRAKDLLILDEATGQMDASNEALVLKSLQNLPPNLAILIITHRPALLNCCEQVYELSDGVLLPRKGTQAAA